WLVANYSWLPANYSSSNFSRNPAGNLGFFRKSSGGILILRRFRRKKRKIAVRFAHDWRP
ncbi:hypothetical protein, partial [Acidiphilium sp. 20-67-58]|uniref:hypothetical protein n=1 Tax=Acidiphilium sp. 20-67-58 TaxID=1970291 RepID=UPI0025C185CD